MKYQIKTTTTSNQRLYLPRSYGGLEFRNVEVETAIQYTRRFWYLWTHPEMRDIKSIYQAMHKKGRRTPIGDYEHICRKYGVPNNDNEMNDMNKDQCKEAIKIIKDADLENRLKIWTQSMHYPKLVQKYHGKISFPATESVFLKSEKLSLINAAAEEQITALRPQQSFASHPCRFKCKHNETAYHVATSCQQHSYTARHDNVAYWLLKEILTITNAPTEVVQQLKFGKATLVADYKNSNTEISIRAGVPIITTNNVKHNKPDIMVMLSGEREAVYVFEVAICHLQNIEIQEQIKSVRYVRNSMVDANHDNVNTISRDLILMEELRQMYHCGCSLGILVVGYYGEILETDAMQRVNH